MTGILIKGEIWTQKTHTEGRWSKDTQWEGPVKMKDWRDVATSWGTPKIAANTRSQERSQEQLLPQSLQTELTLLTPWFSPSLMLRALPSPFIWNTVECGPFYFTTTMWPCIINSTDSCSVLSILSSHWAPSPISSTTVRFIFWKCGSWYYGKGIDFGAGVVHFRMLISLIINSVSLAKFLSILVCFITHQVLITGWPGWVIARLK